MHNVNTFEQSGKSGMPGREITMVWHPLQSRNPGATQNGAMHMDRHIGCRAFDAARPAQKMQGQFKLGLTRRSARNMLPELHVPTRGRTSLKVDENSYAHRAANGATWGASVLLSQRVIPSLRSAAVP